MISSIGGTKDVEDAGGTKKRVFWGAIMGGFAAPRNATKGTTKRKIAQLMEVHATTGSRRNKKERHILGFTDKEKVNGGSNEIFPFVVFVGIWGHDVERCLIDEGISVDILYQDAFHKLGLKKEDLKSYEGT